MPKLKKGSAAAKAYMAKIRSKKNVSGLLGVKKAGHHTAVYYDRIRPHTKAKKVGALPVGRFTKNTLRETLKSQKLRLPGGYSLLHRRVSGLFDTSTIKELDDLKKQYYELAKKYHPDTGGTKEQFQALQKEYENLFKSILSGSSLNSDQKKNEVDIDEAMRKIIDTIISIPDLNIELVGKWLWVSGFTFPYRKELKAAGLSYIAPRKMWAYKGVKSRGGGGDMDDIRAKYGSTPIKPTGGRYIGVPELNKAQKNKLRIYLKKVIFKLNKRII